MKLFISAFSKIIIGAVLLGAMLFLPAGSFCYPGAWLFLGVLFLPMIPVVAVMLVKSPKLLEKRIDFKEKRKKQKGVIALSGLMFPFCFILSALDFRFSLTFVPMWLTVISAVLFITGYVMYAEVMRENAYLSRTVEVQEGQRVISTGLYRLVRHPMYLATLLMFLPMPLILGSFYGLIPISFYIPIIIVRIIDEEKLLENELRGYKEYKEKTKFRLIPFIW